MSAVVEMEQTDTAVAEVRDLTVSFPLPDGGTKQVVTGVSFSVGDGDRIALVGESGSGKTMIGLALLGLAPETATIGGSVTVGDVELSTAPAADVRAMRGSVVSMVFQDPLTSLNPVRTVGSQLVESVRRHTTLSKSEARERVLEAMSRVGIPVPEERLKAYPHELSGGLRQRVVIALAIVNSPQLIVADEPTTALDATIQAQILEVFRTGVSGRSLVLITHDLAVAAEVCTRAMVMYAGEIVETGEIDDILRRPRHPYTRALLAAVPSFDRGDRALVPIAGGPPPNPGAVVGCRFAPRCDFASARCLTEAPPLEDGVACWNVEEVVARDH